MENRPQDSIDGVVLDFDKIASDVSNFNHLHLTSSTASSLHQLIRLLQRKLSTGLTATSIQGFEAYPRYSQLEDMATYGVRPFVTPLFVPNRGHGDFRRQSQLDRLPNTLAQHLRKSQDNNRCLILPLDTVLDTPGFHLSALHVASKAGDIKGRPCVDATHSGLNDGTDMSAITEFLGPYNLPTLKTLAQMMCTAQAQGNTLLHKTDVVAAFNEMPLSVEAALLQACQYGDLVVFPLVAGFGWTAAPAYYNIIAGAIDWAHNGGISDHQLDLWTRTQGRLVFPRNPLKVDRSFTYVDDSCAQSSTDSASGDMSDLQTIITQLLRPGAYNHKKTEGPAAVMTNIGWECTTPDYSIRPSAKGRAKMYYWVFRGLQVTQSISLSDLQRAVGTLRWYSTVVPLASTFELQRVLTTGQRRHDANPLSSTKHTYCTITAPAQREIDWWVWILSVNLHTSIPPYPLPLGTSPASQVIVNRFTSIPTPRVRSAEVILSQISVSVRTNGLCTRNCFMGPGRRRTLTVSNLSPLFVPFLPTDVSSVAKSSIFMWTIRPPSPGSTRGAHLKFSANRGCVSSFRWRSNLTSCSLVIIFLVSIIFMLMLCHVIYSTNPRRS